MAAARSSFDRFDCALAELHNQLCQEADYYTLSSMMNELNDDWGFLRMLWVSIHLGGYNAADKALDNGVDVGESLSPFILKIEAAANEIAQDLVDMKQQKETHQNQYSKSPIRYVDIFSDCQSKTKHLMAEIGGALSRYLMSGCSSLIQVNHLDLSFWTTFYGAVVSRLISMLSLESGWMNEDSRINQEVINFKTELQMNILYIISVCRSDSNFPFPAVEEDGYVDGIGRGRGCHSDHDASMVHAFLIHVASVVVRAAIQICNCRFNYKTDPTIELAAVGSELIKIAEELHREIDPATNAKFIELHLNFLKALNKLGYQGDSMNYFCYYLFKYQQGDFATELSSLIICFLDSKIAEEEVVLAQSLFAEINAVLLETASLLEPLRIWEKFISPPCSDLLTKICLLKVEFCLREQLLRDTNSCGGYPNILPTHENHTGIYQLNQILANLRSFCGDLPHEKTEYGKKMLALVEQVAEELASLFQSFEAKKITKSTLNNSVLQLLFKIVIFRAESFLMELLLLVKSRDAETSFTANGEVQIALLLERLNFFTVILSNKEMMDKEHEDMIAQIEAFLRGITCLSYSNLHNGMTEDVIKKMILSSSELLHKVNHLKLILNEIGPQFPLSKFPKTHKRGFIELLRTKLGELLEYDPESIASVKHHIQEIQHHLKSLTFFLERVSDSDFDELPEFKDLGNRVSDVAYKLEYVIESTDAHAQWQHFFWFYNLLEESKLVSEQASSIQLTDSDAKIQNVNNVNQVSLPMSRDDTLKINEMVVDLKHEELLVDLKDEEKVIIERLTRGSQHRAIVCIVGMPGIGKTTMARKVYADQNVHEFFHCKAWCTVSQVYEKRKLLLEILSYIPGLNNVHQMSNEDLESKLRQWLLKKRYLIVLDDIWDYEAWNDLQNSFPNDANGSRILITSRLRELALEIEPNSDPYSVRPFSDDESWSFLERKVFQAEGCTPELLLVGKEIAQKCKGLPLAVVAISGLLHKTEKSKTLWTKIAESLSTKIMEDPEAQCMKILELSYKHLSGYLKACFLYLGVFLEDRDIPVSKLIRFWLAEGFIGNTKSQNMEDVAESCLADLISRSLVMISKTRSNGKVKACRLHDLIRDLCRSKAKEENFFQLVTRCDKPYASFPISDYGFELEFYHHSSPIAFEAYRLSIFLKRNHFVQSRASGPGTRSLIFFAATDLEPGRPYDISFICHNFKFLRVLDFECINIGVSFPAEIGLLTRLRYLSVSGYLHSIPQTIANLRQLETLIVKGLSGRVVLPESIWHMTKLRHLYVNIDVTSAWGMKSLRTSFN